MSHSNGTSEAIFQRMLRDREDTIRQIEVMQPKLQALIARKDGLDKAKEVFEDYFGAHETPEEFPTKHQSDRRRGRRSNANGHVRLGGEPKKVSETSAAALDIVRESPMGVTLNDIVEVLRDRGVFVKPGPLTRSLNFHASYNKIYRSEDGAWHAVASPEMAVGN